MPSQNATGLMRVPMEEKKIWDTVTRDFEGLATVIKYNGWL